MKLINFCFRSSTLSRDSFDEKTDQRPSAKPHFSLGGYATISKNVNTSVNNQPPSNTTPKARMPVKEYHMNKKLKGSLDTSDMDSLGTYKTSFSFTDKKPINISDGVWRHQKTEPSSDPTLSDKDADYVTVEALEKWLREHAGNSPTLPVPTNNQSERPVDPPAPTMPGEYDTPKRHPIPIYDLPQKLQKPTPQETISTDSINTPILTETSKAQPQSQDYDKLRARPIPTNYDIPRRYLMD